MRSTITAIFTILGCATVSQAAGAQAPAAPVAPKAYLEPADFPDPRAYLAAPPAPGTPGFAADRAAYIAALAGKDGRAWKRAVSQARVRSPAVAGQIMCAIGARVEPAPTSAFGRLMQRSAITLSQASEQSKATWNRDRPYVGEKGAVTCDPDANFGTQSPGYPSGHAGIGWMWGLMLSQLAPERTNQLLAWGAELGENRIACRVHYPSDVAAGRMLGAALLARLQGEPAFRADMEAARAEIASARASGSAPDCPAE
jgi:acid phosphatase (class A)